MIFITALVKLPAYEAGLAGHCRSKNAVIISFIRHLWSPTLDTNALLDFL
jgi:hypothetical protein